VRLSLKVLLTYSVGTPCKSHTVTLLVPSCFPSRHYTDKSRIAYVNPDMALAGLLPSESVHIACTLALETVTRGEVTPKFLHGYNMWMVSLMLHPREPWL